MVIRRQVLSALALLLVPQSRIDAQTATAQVLPAGEYAWTMDVRCATDDACVAAFGGAILPPWMEGFSFLGHIRSDGRRMTYYGSNIFRGRGSAGPAGACESPSTQPFSGVCILGEKAEAFLKVSQLQSPALNGKLTIWVRMSLLYSPRPDGTNFVVSCPGGPEFAGTPCGSEGVETPTLATTGTLATNDLLGRTAPDGVTLFTQLVKLP